MFQEYMENFGRYKLLLLFLFLVGLVGSATAQEFPIALLEAYPPSVDKLSSDDPNERVSILKELVFHVPRSCTMELGLRLKLSNEDYVFVVGKILEKDLRLLDEKSKQANWAFLSHLITKFEMKEFAVTVASYLDEPDWQIHAEIIPILRRLRSTELDGKIAPFMGAAHPYIRQLALDTLLEFRSKKATPALISKLFDTNQSARYWALDKMAEIGAIEAASVIAAKLKDEDDNLQFAVIDTLARLNAKSQSEALWQFLKSNTNKRLEGYAIATLVQFEQKAALPLVVQNLKSVAAGSEEYQILEFIRKLKPKFLIPELITLYNTKTKYFENIDEEKRFRSQVLQLLFEYRTPLAIPIYRENLVDRSSGRDRPNTYVAELLQELNAAEAVDDIITSFSGLARNFSPGSENDHYAGNLAVVLAKFGDMRAWKILIDYVQKSTYYSRELIFIELNRQLDSRLWDQSHTKKSSQRLDSVKAVVESLSRETGIRVIIDDIPRIDVCNLDPTGDREAIACGYSDPKKSLHENLLTIISLLNNGRRGQYTFVYDEGTIRILRVKDAVGFWKTKILSKLI